MLHDCFIKSRRCISKMAANLCSIKRLFAISDIHLDYNQNKQFIENLCDETYETDGLIVAGDVTDNMALLESILSGLRKKFKEVFYVPGNHELWLRGDAKSKYRDSIDKFNAILSLCEKIDVKTRPTKCQLSSGECIWVVPLFSWYCKPEDDEDDSLHVAPKTWVEDVDYMEQVWMDNHHCKWDILLPPGMTQSRYFATINEPFLSASYDADIISFSHFVPNLELIGSKPEDELEVNKERQKLGLGPAPKFQGSTSGFNFTRYAGSRILQEQIERLKSVVHVFGHQHRNRDRSVRGIRYVSHCLGNISEQKQGWVWGISDWAGPKQIWPKVDVTAACL